jgi:fluoroquinolone transport system permease protein
MNILTIFAPRRFLRLMTADAMNVARDPMLAFAVLLSAVPATLWFFYHDEMNAAALAAFGVADFLRYAAPVALLVPAFLIGWVTGFLLLEDRDEGPLLAIDVTAVGKIGFLVYRVSVAALIVLLLTCGATFIIAPHLGPGLKLAVALFVSAATVLSAVVLPALARNKVEGLALTKLTNLASFIPLLAIIPSPWRYIGGIAPTFWLGEVMQLSTLTLLPVPVVLTCAAASNLFAGICLFELFRRRYG